MLKYYYWEGFVLKDKLKGFVFGIVLTTIAMVGMSSFAEMKSIDAFYNGIKILVNGNEIKTDSEPFILNGRTYVPIRFVAEALNMEVKWNESKNQVEIAQFNVVYTPVPTLNNSTPTPTISATPTPTPTIVTTSSPTPTQIPITSFIFRKTNWGMTKQQVAVAEGKAADKDEDNALIYRSISIDGKTTDLSYIFNDLGSMCGIMVKNLSTHTNKNDFIDDFNSFNTMLIGRYGSPISNSPIWKDDLYKDDPDRFGFAISMGQLVYISKWKFDGTEINNYLSGDNYTIQHYLLLQSTVIPQPSHSSGI
jgi:hypothetical protein